ncbi:MAG: response regulator transcription factor [Lachnospiraceae bacterium]|nr:response regulator transcription factor [Lachnospiraceae bacterium]
MRILIIEDEKEMAEGIKGILQKAGYEADMAGDGLAGMDMIMNCQYDLVLLDLMLPMMSGLRLLENVRERGIATPVIILTAKSQTEDKIKGLDCGADDYLIKPFDAGELLARIRARMRNNDEVRRDVVYAYDIQLDRSTYKLRKEAKSIKLSNKEFLLLEYFMLNRGIILTREMIISRVWGFDEDIEYNSVDVYVSFLRKKLGFIKADTAIVTKKGVGYSLEEQKHG